MVGIGDGMTNADVDVGVNESETLVVDTTADAVRATEDKDTTESDARE